MKNIEVWYTENDNRNYIDAVNFKDAKSKCKELSQKGCSGIVVDVFYKDDNGDLIESKSAWYSYHDGKLNKI